MKSWTLVISALIIQSLGVFASDQPKNHKKRGILGHDLGLRYGSLGGYGLGSSIGTIDGGSILSSGPYLGSLGGPYLGSLSSGLLGGSIIGADVHTSVVKKIGVPIPQPYAVPVDRPVPVPYKVAVPYAVDRPYPVHVKVPVAVERHVPYPVPVDRPYPVPHPVEVPVPVPIKKTIVINKGGHPWW